MRVRLGDVCTIKQGVVKDTSNSVWLLNLDKVESETGKIIEFQYVDPNKIGTSTCQFDTGNVLYSKLRPYLNKVVLPDKEGFATSEMLPIRPDTTKILREYLTYYLRSPEFVAYISDKVAGAKMPRARTEDLLNVRLQLPTLDEQTDIVKILSIVSTLITQRKQQLCQLDELIKSQFIEMFGDPVTNTQGRKIVPFKDFMLNIRYGTSQPPVFNQFGKYRFIRATNIKAGRISEQNMLMIDENAAAGLEKCKLNGGEIIIVRSGVNTGDTCIVTDAYVGDYAGYDIIVSLDRSICNPVFFNEMINTHYMEKVVKPLTARSAQPHINAEQVQNLPIVSASLSEQNRFADFVEQVDKSKFVIQKSCDQLVNLKKSLMQQYFA